jgi:plastocyanin
MEYPDIFSVTWSRRLVPAVALLLAMASSNAADIEVTVLDKNGEPVPNIAVYIESNHESSLPAPTNIAVMDQIDQQFVPHLLVVQTGTRVKFPNSDVIAHHVYSFSEPNNFMLPLYKGDLQPRIFFDHNGVVTLGCNIHDHMVGYILVVDSQIFGKTDSGGETILSADNTDGLTVNIWSPRIELKHENLTQTVKPGRSARITFSLKEKLRPPHGDESEALSWNEN